MISQQMPRLDMGNRFGMGETLEAFALTYLAHYNALDLNSRMVLSYLRAWAFDQIIMSPRVSDTKPAYVIAFWRGAGAWKVVIGIEGMTSRSQVATILSALDTTSLWSTSGLVEKHFADRAQEVMVALFNEPLFNAAVARRNTQFTVAGFSLGAAVAEIVAARLKEQNPARIIRLEKFASPRVGNFTWIRGRDPSINVHNTLLNNDPIAEFPQFGLRSGLDTLVTPLNRIVWWQQDPIVDRRSRGGDILGGYLTGLDQTLPRLALKLLGTMDETNPWFDHDRQMYRLMLCNYCAASADHLTYRFNYLEHADENSWQVNFQAGRPFNANLVQLLDPIPADRKPEDSNLPVETLRPRAPQGVVPQTDEPWNDEGDFGVTPPIISVTQRQNRIRTR